MTPYEGKEIDKEKLLTELRKEAPFFMRQLMALDLSGVAGRHTLPVLMTKEKAQAMRAVEAEREFPGLDGDALNAAEAIFRMDKPWGPGTASDLCEAIGDWDGEAAKKEIKSRANTLGRYLKKIQPFLEEKGIILEIDRTKRPYAVFERVKSAPTSADGKTTSMVNALQTPNPPSVPETFTQL